jgi:hypothetical protein
MTTLSVPAPPAHGPHLKLALLLGAAGLLATLALFPYLQVFAPQALARIPLPLWSIAALEAAKIFVVCWLGGWLGLFLGARHGLDAPWLRAWIYRRPWPAAGHAHWAWAAGLGVLAGLLVPGLDWLFQHSAAAASPAGALGMAWRGALASFYGGTVEETLFRLLLVSLLVWLLAKTRHGQATSWMFVVAVVLAALLFGAGHLPGAFAAHLLHGAGSVARIVLLNAVVAVVFGAVFWRWGLEHAMVAHFAADLVLHVAMPLAVLLG